MEFYILPENKQNCERKLELMFKHWTVKPTIEFSPITQVVKTEVIAYKGEGTNDIERNRYTFDAIKVTIEDLTVGEWTLVAEVNYQESIVAIVDGKLFKAMPKKFGLEYKTCDYCGSTRDIRKKSFVVFNNNTQEWRQVGSTCINKMIANGKYIGNIAEKLFECFIVRFGGCDEEGFRSGGWYPKSEYWKKAIRFDYAITLCKMYVKENGDLWKKPKYDDMHRKVADGTNDLLISYESHHRDAKTDRKLYKAVSALFDKKEGGYSDYDGEPTFVQRIKDAFDNEYIAVGEMFLAFFALKEYRDSLSLPDFEKALEENGIEQDTRYTFVGTIISCDSYQVMDYYGDYITVYDTKLKDTKSGLTFSKTLSRADLLDAYKIDTATYAFDCNIGYVNMRKRMIDIRGRVSKSKEYKKRYL